MTETNRKELIINGKFLLASLEGMPRVGREITSAFDDLIEEKRYEHIKIRILAPRGARNVIAFKNIEVQEIGQNKGILWEQIDLPLHLDNRYCINFTGTAPVFRKNGCVVVHDAQFFSSRNSHNWKSFLLYSLITPIVARRYKTIVTVSEYAKREILEYKVSGRKDINIIFNSADHILSRSYDDSIITTLCLHQNQFMLANSYAYTHKNVRILFDAIMDNPYLCSRLVLFGSSTRSEFENRGIRVPERVRFVGRISDGQLVALMKCARMFLFPSTTEGFGLPPLEAMALGCPTICASAGAMPEICGGGAIYASPNDPQDWRRQIERLWNSNDERNQLSEAGRQQASLYSWRRSAERYLDLISSGLSLLGDPV